MCVHIELSSTKKKKQSTIMGYDIYEMLTAYMGLTKTVSCKLWKHKMYDRKNKLYQRLQSRKDIRINICKF